MHIAILYAIIIILLSERIGKLIPDSATGPLGLIRKVFKFVGLYVSNVK